MKLCLRLLLCVLPFFLLAPCAGAASLTKTEKEYRKKVAEQIILADKGDAVASYELGRKFHYKPENWGWYGLTKEGAIAKGLEYYKKAAALNHVPSLHYLGKIYLNGDRELGLASDRLASETYYLKALALGSPTAQWELSIALLGTNDQAVLQRNLAWLLPLVEKGDSDAMLTYAGLLMGRLQPAQPEKAQALYEQSAAKGNLRAKEILQRQANERLNAERQAQATEKLAQEKAAKQLAAEQAFEKRLVVARTDPATVVTLGYQLRDNNWTDAQRHELARLLEQVAATGNLEAQKVAATAFGTGLGIQNQEKAFYWEMEAAKQKDASAAYRVGLRYADGDGVAKDETQAVSWLRRANEPHMQPYAEWHIKRIEAQFPNAGATEALHAGLAAEKAGRYAEAAEKFTYAANANLPEAMAHLGGLYLTGRGVPKNLDQADFWLRLTLSPRQLDPAVYAYVNQAREQLRIARDQAPIGVGFNGGPSTALKPSEIAARQAAAAAAAAAQVASRPGPIREIGQRVGDGIVCWVDGSGQHGLILSLAEIPSGKPGDAGPRPATLDAQTGLSTWYLPTLEEWRRVRPERRRIEQALEQEKGMPLARNGYYWTDTAVLYSDGVRGERVANNWCYEPINGSERESDPKTTRAAVRTFRQF